MDPGESLDDFRIVYEGITFVVERLIGIAGVHEGMLLDLLNVLQDFDFVNHLFKGWEGHPLLLLEDLVPIFL